MLHYENLQFYLRLGLKLKKKHHRIQSITMVKSIYWIQHAKKNRTRKNGNKDGKVLNKLMNNTKYRKTMEKVRNRINLRLQNNEKEDYLKWTLKPSTNMSQKIFDNNLVTVIKSKVILMLNKLAYVGICILELSKVLLFEFLYD